MTPVLPSPKSSHFSGHCIGFLGRATNYHKSSGFKQHLLLFYRFCRAEVQAQHSWVLCAGSRKSKIKMSVELHSYLKLKVFFLLNIHSCYSKNSIPCSWRTEVSCLSPGDLSQLLAAGLRSYPWSPLITQHLL